jgi:hypothetical protein
VRPRRTQLDQHRKLSSALPTVQPLAVDSDGDQKFRALVQITLDSVVESDLVIDRIADRISEPILYTPPPGSELIALGVVRQGPQRISPTHGRKAHVVEPTDALVTFLGENDPDGSIEIERLIGESVAARLIEARRARRTAQRSRTRLGAA